MTQSGRQLTPTFGNKNVEHQVVNPSEQQPMTIFRKQSVHDAESESMYGFDI